MVFWVNTGCLHRNYLIFVRSSIKPALIKSILTTVSNFVFVFFLLFKFGRRYVYAYMYIHIFSFFLFARIVYHFGFDQILHRKLKTTLKVHRPAINHAADLRLFLSIGGCRLYSSEFVHLHTSLFINLWTYGNKVAGHASPKL
jgi:hypothetical protein